MISGFYDIQLYCTPFIFRHILLTMSKARKDKASLQSRLLQDSDEDEDIQHYKDAKDWGLTPRRKLDLLTEFDSEGGIGQWTRGSGLLEKICSKQPDRFGTQETNPRLFKKTKNFATRFKSCQHKERKKASLIKQAEAEETKVQQQPQQPPKPPQQEQQPKPPTPALQKSKPTKMPTARTPPRGRTPRAPPTAQEDGTCRA